MVGDKGKRYIILGMKQINFHSIIGNMINQYKHTKYKTHFIDIIKLLKIHFKEYNSLELAEPDSNLKKLKTNLL